MEPPPRRARLVVVTPSGALVGELPPFRVATPWWQETGDVVAGARSRWGVDVVVLRLLSAERDRPPGGLVTYLVEVGEGETAALREALRPFEGVLTDHPLRMPWAAPGGPGKDLRWAAAVLEERGMVRDGEAVQVRTWNLSSLWRLPLRNGSNAWLKVVPPFFAHEGAVLCRLQGGPVPRLLGHDDQRIVMAEVPGEDLYDADPEIVKALITKLVTLQAAWVERVDDLRSIGLPDWRSTSLTTALAGLVDRWRAELDPSAAAVLASFVAALPARLATVEACGLPDTIVHGDFHPGNARGDGRRLVLLDWADCGVGQPMLDMPALLERLPPDAIDPVRAHWVAAWRAVVPGSDPVRAAALLAPVAAARQALIYDRFLAGIEPAERVYHAADPPEWLHRVVTMLADGA